MEMKMNVNLSLYIENLRDVCSLWLQDYLFTVKQK